MKHFRPKRTVLDENVSTVQIIEPSIQYIDDGYMKNIAFYFILFLIFANRKYLIPNLEPECTITIRLNMKPP